MEAIKRIRDLIKDINTIVDNTFVNLQSWSEFKKVKIGQEITLENGVRYIKIFETKEQFRFLTIMPPLTSFNEHWHDCDECITILSGELSDLVTQKKYTINQQIIIPRWKKHSPLNGSKTKMCTLLVDFYK